MHFCDLKNPDPFGLLKEVRAQPKKPLGG